MRLALIALALIAQISLTAASQLRPGNPNFLIENWLEGDGLPESAAFAVAQSADGYLWVGTGQGIYQFNGSVSGDAFTPAGRGTNAPQLRGIVQYLHASRSGRLWASSESGLSIRENEIWRTIQSTNTLARSIAEDRTGRVLLGTYDGRLFSFQDEVLAPFQIPDGLTPSGVFCLTDLRDGGLWLANRGFYWPIDLERLDSGGSGGNPAKTRGCHQRAKWRHLGLYTR